MEKEKIELHGFCAPQFANLEKRFRQNFEEGTEVGARLSLIVRGETVADIWAGWSDLGRTRPWDERTIVNVWSATKGLIGTSFAMIVDQGLAAYDDPVSRYWPEFAAAGKQAITIGMLLAHQAGLSAFRDPASIDDLLAGERAAARLAAQTPLWEPGEVSGYHGMTLGVLATALFERIEGRSLKRFVAEEIAQAYGLDLSIGVTPADRDRVAEMAPVSFDLSALAEENPIRKLTFGNPVTPADLWKDPRWQAADLPSGNGFMHAGALASLYDLLLHPRGERPLVSKPTLEQATRCRFEGIDMIKGSFTRWSAGYWLNPGEIYGPNPEAFGHSGWGGAFAFADPIADIAVAYTMNRMSDRFDADPRRRNLIGAVYAAL